MSGGQFPAKPGGCEEAVMPFPGMTKAFSCNAPATRNVGWPRRGEGPYRMCDQHAHHTVRNRGGVDLGEYRHDLKDRQPANLDLALLSREGCSRCEAGASEPHTFPCVNMRVAEAIAKTTVTGRRPSEPNIQNIPIRTEEGAAIRRAFTSETK